MRSVCAVMIWRKLVNKAVDSVIFNAKCKINNGTSGFGVQFSQQPYGIARFKECELETLFEKTQNFLYSPRVDFFVQ